IPLHPESTKYTGFTFMGKSYTYLVLPQGLKTSVGSFSRAMDVILGVEVRSFCVNYLDDLVVFSRDDDIDVHFKHLDTVLALLKDAGMTCRLSKCQFIQTQTDSSKVGIAGCLYQLDKENQESVVGFCSKGLTPSEQRWTVSEQELWAIVYSLKKFETYLRGARTVIRTDHKSLSFINNWSLYSARVTRWIMYLQRFDYIVEYVKGKDNIVPDVLSRYARGAEDILEFRKLCPQIAMFTVPKAKKIITKLKDIVLLQRDDIELRKLLDHLRENPGSTIRGPKGQFVIENNKLMHRSFKSGQDKLVVPKAIHKSVVQAIHEEAGHFGEARIKRLISDRFYIPNLTKTLKQILRSCDLCQKAKHTNKSTVGECKAVLTNDVGEIVMVDWYGPLPVSRFGMQYILVVQDSFSKYVQLYPARRATTQAAIKSVVKYYGLIQIKTIVSDNGRQFTSKAWYETLQGMGIRVSHTTVRNPRPNSTERVNKELGRLMRSYCHGSHSSWALIITNIERCYNNTIHASTGYTPLEILTGERPELTVDSCEAIRVYNKELLDVEMVRENVRKNLRQMAQCRISQYNKRHNIENYQIGDLVKIRRDNYSKKSDKVCKKFSLLYEGPYKVGGIPYTNA
ncbi:unnamed protein product, partial [Arctia plantaginis]